MKHLILLLSFSPLLAFGQCDSTKKASIISQLEKEFTKRPGLATASFRLKKDGTLRILSGAKSLSTIWLYDYQMPFLECEFSILEKKGKPYALVIYNEGLTAKYLDSQPEQAEGSDNVSKAANGVASASDTYVDATSKQYIASVNIEKKIEIELDNAEAAKKLIEDLQCIVKAKTAN